LHVLLRRGCSPRTLLYIALALFSLSFLLVGALPSLLHAIIGLAILEIGWGLLTPNLTYLRNLIIPSEHRASLLSLISTIANFASALIVTSVSICIVSSSLFQAYEIVSLLGIASLMSFHAGLSCRTTDSSAQRSYDDRLA